MHFLVTTSMLNKPLSSTRLHIAPSTRYLIGCVLRHIRMHPFSDDPNNVPDPEFHPAEFCSDE